MFESVLSIKLRVFDLALVTIVHYAVLFNTLLIYEHLLRHLFLLDTHSKSVYIIDRVFLVFFIDLSRTDNS